MIVSFTKLSTNASAVGASSDQRLQDAKSTSHGWRTEKIWNWPEISAWNRKAATKHCRDTLRLAAKTAKENPSDKFCATLVPCKKSLKILHMGVDPSQIEWNDDG